jgi:hypothetical protein
MGNEESNITTPLNGLESASIFDTMKIYRFDGSIEFELHPDCYPSLDTFKGVLILHTNRDARGIMHISY